MARYDWAVEHRFPLWVLLSGSSLGIAGEGAETAHKMVGASLLRSMASPVESLSTVNGGPSQLHSHRSPGDTTP